MFWKHVAVQVLALVVLTSNAGRSLSLNEGLFKPTEKCCKCDLSPMDHSMVQQLHLVGETFCLAESSKGKKCKQVCQAIRRDGFTSTKGKNDHKLPGTCGKQSILRVHQVHICECFDMILLVSHTRNKDKVALEKMIGSDSMLTFIHGFAQSYGYGLCDLSNDPMEYYTLFFKQEHDLVICAVHQIDLLRQFASAGELTDRLLAVQNEGHQTPGSKSDGPDVATMAATWLVRASTSWRKQS